jgi:hypothetical protein
MEHGTTFYLRFPLAEIPANGDQPAVAPEGSVSKA